jgi:hypothetical protein
MKCLKPRLVAQLETVKCYFAAHDTFAHFGPDRHGRWLTVSRKDLDKAKQWFDRHGVCPCFFVGLCQASGRSFPFLQVLRGCRLRPFSCYVNFQEKKKTFL